ncbi:MAG: hypothetical protein MI723_09240, partial [Caulobacterales bacterium]|nr:hypothetical protein [Caulobacterales bacterium]
MTGVPPLEAGLSGLGWLVRRPLSGLFVIAVFAFLLAAGLGLAALALAGPTALAPPFDVAGLA